MVRSVLLFGASIWGVVMPAKWVSATTGGVWGKLEAFYRKCLRWALGVGRDVRNEVLYTVAQQHPIQLMVLKGIVRYRRYLLDRRDDRDGVRLAKQYCEKAV